MLPSLVRFTVGLGLLLSGHGCDEGDVAGQDAALAGGDDASSPGALACGDAPEHSGEGTYYGADGTGNCSFDASPADLLVAAMNQSDYAQAASCGTCVGIEGPSGQVTVRIVDRCPECAPGDIDLSPQAFGLIAPLERGRVPIRWRYQSCAVQGNVRYRFKEGSNPWWTAVQVRNHRHAIAKLEYAAADGKFVEVPRESYNYFVQSSGMGSGPFTFRITDRYGHELIDTNLPLVEGQEVSGAGQFPDCK